MRALVTTPRGAVFDTFFPPENVRLAESLGEILWNETERQLSPEEVAARIADCDTCITTWGAPRLDETLLAAAPKLKVLCHLCGTVKPVTSDALWERGIKVLSGNRFFAESVAEGTLAYMLAALRKIPFYSERLKNEKRWKQPTDTNRGLCGKKIGIISYGAIAKHLVRLLSVFRVELYVYDIVPLPAADVETYRLHQASLAEIFAACDIITVHTPAIPETYHLIDRELFGRIKAGALFINTSRGTVIDQRALEDELQDGRFSAVLDVYEQEPPKPDSPLYRLPNVMMMPHMGGPTVDLRAVITAEMLPETANWLSDPRSPLPSEIICAQAMMMSSH